MSKSILTEFVSVRTLERILDNFSTATGLACIIRNKNGYPITKISNPTKFWQEVIKNKKVSEDYKTQTLQIFEKVIKTGQNEIYKRFMDTYAFIVPIYIEGKAEAFFVGGLGRLGNPNIEECEKESKQLNMDLDKFLELYLMLPLVTLEKIESSANLLRIIGSTISNLAIEGEEAKAKIEELSENQGYLEEKIKENSKQLHKSEERYKRLFNTINEGVYVTDKNGIITEINKQGAKILGYNSPEEIIGEKIQNIYVNPKDREELLRIISWKGYVESFKPLIKLKDGTQCFIETNSSVIKDKNGLIIGVQGIFKESTKIGEHRSIKTSNQRKKINEPSSTNITSTTNNKNPLRTT